MTFFKYDSHSRSDDDSDDDNNKRNSASDSNSDSDASVDTSPRYTHVYAAFSNIYITTLRDMLRTYIAPIFNNDY